MTCAPSGVYPFGQDTEALEVTRRSGMSDDSLDLPLLPFGLVMSLKSSQSLLSSLKLVRKR